MDFGFMIKLGILLNKYRVFNLKVDRNTLSSTVNRIMKA